MTDLPIPRVILNAAMSLDGKIATKTIDVELSSSEDWVRVHLLRNSVDAIMVGIGTILTDDSKLTVKEEYLPEGVTVRHPLRVIVDTQARIPTNARAIKYQPEVPTVIAVGKEIPKQRKIDLKDAGVTILECETNEFGHINLRCLMEQLYEQYDVRTVLLEGGSNLNWGMLEERLIDEIQIAIAPVVAGGTDSRGLFEGKGFEKFHESPYFTFLEQKWEGDCLVLYYTVDYQKQRK